MPTYDYRCDNCGERFSLFYKTYSAYDNATPICPTCESEALSRVIKRITVQNQTHDFGKMSSHEMLSVFESGDSRAVGEMFQQVGGSDPALGKEYHDATQKLLKGESMDKVEKDLQANDKAKKSKP
ncbi:MAG: zinc ribbon domain-containing protein [Aggregatilineales bacterium]